MSDLIAIVKLAEKTHLITRIEDSTPVAVIVWSEEGVKPINLPGWLLVPMGPWKDEYGQLRGTVEEIFEYAKKVARKKAAERSLMIVNDKSYAPIEKSTPHNTMVLRVDAILDMVPGAFHHPQDLMQWINSNPYVRSVTMESCSDNAAAVYVEAYLAEQKKNSA